MLTLEQEIELLLSVLSVVEDAEQYAEISMKILDLNKAIKTKDNLS